MNAPPVIPDHTLLRPIGRGAYGEVWLARNVMGVLRAVKIVERRQFDNDRPYEREFAGIQRYEPVSRSADGLVHVLHVGRNESEGYFYYVMELADPAVGDPHAAARHSVDTHPESALALLDRDPRIGDYVPRTLRFELKHRNRLPVGECLRVALDIVGGLARLHERGLVHRDVKPGNIIFVEGRAKLADIGLVSRESEGRTFVGTEGYIPPEGPGSPGADLYALGMVLYEAATGFPPDRFPNVPSEWFAEEADTEPLEFHAVVLKACEGAKERRYQSSAEMQADLALLQSGRSVRRLRALEERVAGWRRAGWMAAACVAIAVGASLVSNWRAKLAADRQAQETKLLDQAMHSLARAESAERESRQQLFAALLEQARATVRSGEMGQRVQALDAVRRAAAISNTAELRREVVAALSLPDLRFQRELPYGPDFLLRQLDPTFDRIAVSRSRGPVEIHAVEDGRLLATLAASTNRTCYNVLWSADGRYLAANRDHDLVGYRSDLEVWDLKDTPRQLLLIRDVRWKARAFHPTRPEFLVAKAEGLLTAWDLETGKELARGNFDATPQDLAYSPDGDRVVATYQRAGRWGASVHRAVDGAMLCSSAFPVRVRSIAWDPTGRWIALSDEGGVIHLMDARTGESRVLGRHNAEAVNTTFEADGRFLITGAWGRELVCWDILSRQRAFTLNVDSCVAQFRADGRACAISTTDGVQLHSFEGPTAHRELPEELTPRVRHAEFSLDGRWLAASSDEQLAVWDLVAGGPGALISYASNSRVFWSANGELIASRSRGSDCFRWRVHAAKTHSTAPVLERLPFHKPEQLTSLSARSNLVAWTSAKGSRISEQGDVANDGDHWIPTAGGINGMSTDARWLAIYAPYSTHLSVYRMPELAPVARLTHQGRIAGFSFSPSGEELVVGSTGQLEFWSTKTWEHTRVATNFVGIPGVAALFQEDGRSLWLAKNLRNAGLYEAKTLDPQLHLPNGMLPLALSPDGKQLAVSVGGRRVQLWNLVELRQELSRLGLGW